MYKINKIGDYVFHLEFKERYQLGMTFLRYQEFYESSMSHIKGKSFTISDFIISYIQEFGNLEKPVFTYFYDWSGFNIPVHVIEEVKELGIIDPNEYDEVMNGIYSLIKLEQKGKKAYLIGTYTEPTEGDSEDKYESTLAHEITHAMFYVDQNYADDVRKVICETPEVHSVCHELSTVLKNMGYADEVIVDEINAYMTTGELEKFVPIEKKNKKNYNLLKEKLSNLWKEKYNTFIGKNS